MDWARLGGYVVFTHDLDFGALLYATGAVSPSVLQIRAEDIRPQVMGELVVAAIQKSRDALETGALVTIDPRKMRVAVLPLKARKREDGCS